MLILPSCHWVKPARLQQMFLQLCPWQPQVSPQGHKCFLRMSEPSDRLQPRAVESAALENKSRRRLLAATKGVTMAADVAQWVRMPQVTLQPATPSLAWRKFLLVPRSDRPPDHGSREPVREPRCRGFCRAPCSYCSLAESPRNFLRKNLNLTVLGAIRAASHLSAGHGWRACASCFSTR